MGKATQLHRAMAVGTPLGDDVLLLRGFTFTERLGRPFEMSLDMLSDHSDIKFEDIVGQNVTVRLQTPKSDEPRYFNGIVSQFVQGRQSGRTTEYRATVVPWLWLLTRTSDCRIFQNMTVRDIIKQVFRDHGLTDFEEKGLSGTYRQWENCVEYRETDFNFASRLMEQEGLYYHFRHENGKHKMILVDSKGAHDPFPDYAEIPFRPPDSGFREKEHVHEWVVAQAIQPGLYSHTDFNFEKSRTDLKAQSQVSRPSAASDFEIYDYPGEYAEAGEGQNYAKVRIQELQTDFEVIQGSSDARGIAAGCKFKLTDHPRADWNKEYLVTGVSLSASTDEYDSAPGAGRGTTFDCSFTCIDAKEQFRAARTTPKPMIRGPQTAIVVGPAGDEIHTEKFGRVKVQFHWDRYSKANENSSCWIRVSQPWAGKKWGGVFLPRIGQEVIVEFLEGDPDRPIVTGRVYNDAVMPPYELPANATMSTFKSNSSKGGGGFNEIRFEDKKDSEQVFIHAQKNKDERVQADSKEWVGNDRHLIVKKKQFEKVEEEKHLIVLKDQIEEIGGDRHARVKGNHNEKVDQTISITAGMKKQEKIGTNYAVDAGQEIHLKGGMKVIIEAGMQLTIKGAGGFVDIGPAGVTIQGTLVNINSGGSAGVGSGSSPDSPKAPTEALEADADNAGEVSQPPPTPTPPKPATYSAQATVMKMAAAEGKPFCEKCAAAAAARQQQQQAQAP